MKKKFLIFSIFLCSCGATGIKDEVHRPKSDTARTIVLFLTDSLQARVDRAYRVIKDTFAFDTVTAKPVWGKDTLYFVPIPIAVRDSLNRPVLDTLGRPQYQIQFLRMINNNILWDFNKDVP